MDTARKVVGVGSVGTRAFIVLLYGRDAGDPLFLQVKEATASVLEHNLPKSRHKQHGERVVQVRPVTLPRRCACGAVAEASVRTALSYGVEG